MAFMTAIPLGRVGGRGHYHLGSGGPLPMPATSGVGVSHRPWRPGRTATSPIPTPTLPPPAAPTTFDTVTTTPRCGALEDSKKRNKYNIPDLNDQYRAEVAEMERKYGGRPPSSSAPSAGGNTRRSSPTGSVLYQPPVAGVRADTASSDRATADATVDRTAALAPYRRVQRALVGDTLTLGCLAISAAWAALPVTDAKSVGVGVGASLAYVYLLGRGVDRLADEAVASGGKAGASDGLAPARIGIAGLLLVGAARSGGALHVLPALAGFFVYKVAALVPLVTGAAFED
ncbi:hypothetical protein MMPV_000490 [Pyropia vietnamensis]